MAEEIYSLQVPLTKTALLLPSVCVAEIVDAYPPQPVPGMPIWLLGLFDWRKRQVPLFDYEMLNGRRDFPSAATRIAILNTLGPDRQRAFMGMTVQGIPHLVRIQPQALRGVEQQGGPLTKMFVQGPLGRAELPDLLAIESQLQQLQLPEQW